MQICPHQFLGRLALVKCGLILDDDCHEDDDDDDEDVTVS